MKLILTVNETIVKDIMTEFIQTVPTGTTIIEAALLMSKIKIGCVMVSLNEVPIGMLTERDIVSKVTSLGLDPSKLPVEKVMSQPIITIEQERIIDEAALMMSVYGIRRLAVIGKEGRITGIITTTDIASWLSRNENYKNNVLNAIARIHRTESTIPYQ